MPWIMNRKGKKEPGDFSVVGGKHAKSSRGGDGICTSNDAAAQKTSQKSSTTTSAPPQTVSLDALAVEDLLEIFIFCDIKTRCKLRRVSHYWKHSVSCPEVSDVVMIDLIPNRNMISLPIFLGARNVRVLIYDQGGAQTRSRQENNYENCRSFLRTIGKHCVNVEHLILKGAHIRRWNCAYKDYHSTTVPLWRDHPNLTNRFEWLPRDSTSGFPMLKSITLVASKLVVGAYEDEAKMALPQIPTVQPPYRNMPLMQANVCELIINVPSFRLEWPNPENEHAEVTNLEACLWPYPETQRAWVARYAPQLPEPYHVWAASETNISRVLKRRLDGREARQCETHNLVTAKYDQMSPMFLCLLSSFILRKKAIHPKPHPPPFPLDAAEVCCERGYFCGGG